MILPVILEVFFEKMREFVNIVIKVKYGDSGIKPFTSIN